MTKALHATIVVWALLFAASPALAQQYPVRPVKVIDPYPAGGGLDMMCRTVIDRLSNYFGQPFVLENRPGGGGTIGAAAVAQAAPDGYTLFCGNTSEITLAPYVMQGVPYDPERDFAPLAMAVSQTVVLVAHPSVPVTDARQLLELTRKKPLSYAHPGVGGTIHIAMEMLSAEAKAPFTHVPYKGAAGLVTDVLAGHVPLAIINLAPLAQHIRDKKLRALMVFQSERNPSLPDVPTTREVVGVDVIASSWFGFLAPSKVPADIRAKLDREIRRALAEPVVRSKLTDVHMEVVGMPAAEFGEYIKKERAQFELLVKRFDFKAD